MANPTDTKSQQQQQSQNWMYDKKCTIALYPIMKLIQLHKLWIALLQLNEAAGHHGGIGRYDYLNCLTVCVLIKISQSWLSVT